MQLLVDGHSSQAHEIAFLGLPDRPRIVLIARTPRPMNETSNYNRDTVLKELEHRRKKQWDIFSWTSTIFTAITGGVIALKVGEHPHSLNIGQQIVLTVAVFTLAGYSVTSIYQNISLEDEARNALEELSERLVTTDRKPKIGYGAALSLLAAAVAAIWIPA